MLCCQDILKQKHFGNTSQIPIFITEIHVEINTYLNGILQVNAITILFINKSCMHSSQAFFGMARSACHKKNIQNINILSHLHVQWRLFLTVLVDSRVPRTVLRRLANRLR